MGCASSHTFEYNFSEGPTEVQTEVTELASDMDYVWNEDKSLPHQASSAASSEEDGSSNVDRDSLGQLHWRCDIKTLFALLALCGGRRPVDSLTKGQ